MPILGEIPVVGTLFFSHDLMTYLSYLIIPLAWVWIFRTRPGLMLQGIGEKPAAAFVRGASVNRLRYFYTVLGGAIMGLAGPIYSLSVKAGWKGTISGLDGLGWIALAITIFGGWNPIRAALGVYLFAFLQWLGLVLQPSLPGRAFAGASGGAIPAHDHDPAAGEYRQYGVGDSHAGDAAGALKTFLRAPVAGHACFTARLHLEPRLIQNKAVRMRYHLCQAW